MSSDLVCLITPGDVCIAPTCVTKTEASAKGSIAGERKCDTHPSYTAKDAIPWKSIAEGLLVTNAVLNDDEGRVVVYTWL